MSSDFIKSNPALDDAVNGANNFETLRERMLQTLASQGVISRDRADAYNVRVNPDSPALARPEASLPDGRHGAPTCIRVIYPGGNARIEIIGLSEADLDAQEERIRKQYIKKN